MSHIDSTLAERGSRYGEFTGHAEITQSLKEVMQATDNWPNLADDQKEALEMTAHKIGRILNGDPNYIDSWHDIIGYIRLVEQRLVKEQDKPGLVEPQAVCRGQAKFADVRDVLNDMAARNAQRKGPGPEIKITFIDEDPIA